MADVRLVDLEVLKRFSLVLRREHAEAEEVLAALEASRLQVLRNLGERVSRGQGEADLVDRVPSEPPVGAVKSAESAVKSAEKAAEPPPTGEPSPTGEPDRRRERPLRAPSRPGPSSGPTPTPGSPRT